MKKELLPLVLALGGCAAPTLSEEAACEHPALVSGDYDAARQPAVDVSVRDDRDVEKVARRIAAKYHVEAKPLSLVHGLMILNVTTEQAARELAEQLRCDPDVKAVSIGPSEVHITDPPQK
jgi:hypothetical protein